uniref:DUF8040 domain-containing protein n=1 Tax=Ananas comosus var. bracteatus TaxID=296719 RepID=A0A6V7PK07_ANACO|nr:unnamed protein product [Ananas comosus var. bracteatus]
MANPLYKRIFSSATISTIMTILDDDDESIEAMMLLDLESEPVSNRVPRQRCRTRPFIGHQMLCDILSGHHECCCNHFRMSATTFIALRDALGQRGLISSTRNMTADEQLGIFLYGVGHGVTNRILAETFQHSGETISRHFNNVLRGIVRLKDDYIMLPSSNAAVHPRIQDNPNFHPFKNAIGAIDGTHIPVVVERRWEGSAADMRVLRWAYERGGFVVPEATGHSRTVTMAQQLRIGNQWIRKQCLELTRKKDRKRTGCKDEGSIFETSTPDSLEYIYARAGMPSGFLQGRSGCSGLLGAVRVDGGPVSPFWRQIVPRARYLWSLIELDRDTLHTRLGSAHECHSGVRLVLSRWYRSCQATGFGCCAFRRPGSRQERRELEPYPTVRARGIPAAGAIDASYTGEIPLYTTNLSACPGNETSGA